MKRKSSREKMESLSMVQQSVVQNEKAIFHVIHLCRDEGVTYQNFFTITLT